jgi:MFS family permease
MKKELIVLFSINVLSAIGYSLIAPLYPPVAAERGVKEYMVGLIISLFAITNFIVTPFSPQIISKYGRRKVFYFAMTLEVYNYNNLGFMYMDIRDTASYI